MEYSIYFSIAQVAYSTQEVLQRQEDSRKLGGRPTRRHPTKYTPRVTFPGKSSGSQEGPKRLQAPPKHRRRPRGEGSRDAQDTRSSRHKAGPFGVSDRRDADRDISIHQNLVRIRHHVPCRHAKVAREPTREFRISSVCLLAQV